MKYVNTYSTVKDIDLAVANMREFLKNEYENSVGTFPSNNILTRCAANRNVNIIAELSDILKSKVIFHLKFLVPPARPCNT